MISFSQPRIQHLLEQLKKFGLNPSEWRVSNVNSRTIRLQNRSDKNFKLRGLLIASTHNGFELNELSLVSL